MDNREKLVEEYIAAGMTEGQARAMAGMSQEVADVSEGVEWGDIDDGELVALNAKLGVRAIHAALKSGKHDSVTLQAAIRAVNMYEEEKGRSGGDDPEDDMLAWVAEVRAKELSGE